MILAGSNIDSFKFFLHKNSENLHSCSLDVVYITTKCEDCLDTSQERAASLEE